MPAQPTGPCFSLIHICCSSRDWKSKRVSNLSDIYHRLVKSYILLSQSANEWHLIEFYTEHPTYSRKDGSPPTSAGLTKHFLMTMQTCCCSLPQAFNSTNNFFTSRSNVSCGRDEMISSALSIVASILNTAGSISRGHWRGWTQPSGQLKCFVHSPHINILSLFPHFIHTQSWLSIVRPIASHFTVPSYD